MAARSNSAPQLRSISPRALCFYGSGLIGLSISSQELYEKLKQRGLIIVPAITSSLVLPDKTWRHQYECIRLIMLQVISKKKTRHFTLQQVINEL